MHVKSIRLREHHFGNQWEEQVKDRWNYNDFRQDKGWRRDWISFDSLCYDPSSDIVYTGITSFDADIFWGWDRRSKTWKDLNYSRVANTFDAKFHRSLVRDPRDGAIYAAPALLHDIDRYWEAPGAAIIRYYPNNDALSKLGTPIEHVYIQAIVLDVARDKIYGQTFPPEYLIEFDLKTHQSRCLGPTSGGMSLTQGENIVIDDKHRVWGVWQTTRAWQSQPGVDSYRLFRFDPVQDKIHYFEHGLPNHDGKHGFSKPEAFFNLGTGCLYASGQQGTFYRIDPESAKATFLFQPIGDENRGRRSRMTSMVLSPDGYAYSVVGRDGECELLRFHTATEKYELLGKIKEPETGAEPWQIHDLTITADGVIYAAENDNPQRSSFLWEIKL